MTPDELRVMNNENCVLFIRGLYPFFSTKYPLEKHPNYHLTGDANDDQLYNVREEIHTGRSAEKPKRQSRPLRIMKDVERADSREAERQHRMNTRPVQQRSAKGRPLGQVTALTDEVPTLQQITDPDKLTREQIEQLRRETEHLTLRSISRPEELSREDYLQDQIAAFQDLSSFYDIPGDVDDYDKYEEELARGEE